ncbi:E3 SUMO-protein ligase ZBED1-like [Cyprinodon tularosa]|nr:E3 SUMO-protein ligase ZBED1-like [Cyprinodon tularosa]
MLLQAVEQRFSHISTESVCFLATVLDPRYKDCFFDQATKKEAMEVLTAKMRSQTENEPEEEPHEKRTRTDDNNNNTSLQKMYEEILHENATNELNHSQADQQIQAYLSEPTIPRSESPLDYWRSNKIRFPQLALLARKYLSSPCTSVDSERLFSAAANVIDEKRNRLGCEKAEMLLFVKKNLPLVPSPRI